MIDLAIDRGGLKDSENAPNSFFPKINRTLFWRLGTDMLWSNFFYHSAVFCGKFVQNAAIMAFFRHALRD